MPPSVGDSFEMDTPCGLAYFQVAANHPEYRTLIRVLPGLYETRPDLSGIVSGPDRFKAFYPVASAVRQRLVRNVGTFGVPEGDAPFPLMKWPLGGEGHRNGWVIWDGRREIERRRTLTKEQAAYPEPGIWNHALLVDNVASDWSWRDTAEPPPWRRAVRPPGCDAPFSDELDDDQGPLLTSHFLYFDKRSNAEIAARAVRETLGIGRTQLSEADDPSHVLLLIQHAPTLDPESLRRGFEQLARKHRGEYDGWEAAANE